MCKIIADPQKAILFWTFNLHATGARAKKNAYAQRKRKILNVTA